MAAANRASAVFMAGVTYRLCTIDDLFNEAIHYRF